MLALSKERALIFRGLLFSAGALAGAVVLLQTPGNASAQTEACRCSH